MPRRKETRQPDTTFQLSEHLEAAVWLENGGLDWSMAYVDPDAGTIHKTFSAELLLEVPKFVENLAGLLATDESGLPVELRFDLQQLSDALASLNVQEVPQKVSRVVNGITNEPGASGPLAA